MSDPSAIAAALLGVEGVFAQLGRTVDTGDLEQRRRLIELRRLFNDRLGDLDRTVNAVAGGTDRMDAIAEEFRDRFTAVRRAASLHQAEWPTILMADDMPGYAAASRALGGKMQAFLRWMKHDFLAAVAKGR